MKTPEEIKKLITEATCDLLAHKDAEDLNSFCIFLHNQEIDWWRDMHAAKLGGWHIICNDTLFEELEEVNYNQPGGWTEKDVAGWVEVMFEPDELLEIAEHMATPEDCETPEECAERAEAMQEYCGQETAQEIAEALARRYFQLCGKLETWQKVEKACTHLWKIFLPCGCSVDFTRLAAEVDEDTGETIPGDSISEGEPAFFEITQEGLAEQDIINAIEKAYGKESISGEWFARRKAYAIFPV